MRNDFKITFQMILINDFVIICPDEIVEKVVVDSKVGKTLSKLNKRRYRLNSKVYEEYV